MSNVDWGNEDFQVDRYTPDNVKAKRAGLAAQGANPDQSAQAFDIAPQIGLPASIAQYNVPAFKEQVQQQQNDALVDAHPQLAKFVSDPAVAAAVKDDYGPLAQLSTAIQSYLNPGGPTGGETDVVGDTVLGKSVQSGYSHQNYAREAALYQAGAAGLEPRLRQYESEFQREKRYEGFDKYVAALGGFVGSTASSLQAAAPAAAVGAGVGALAGGVGAPLGATVGFGAGFLGDLAVTTSGQTYRRLDLVRDDQGRAIPEGVKQAASLAAGSVGLSVALATGGVAGKVAGNLIGDGVSMALSRAGVADAISAGVGGTLKAGIAGGTINSAIALSAELTPILAQKFSGLDINDPNEWQHLREVAADAFTNGALLFGGWHGVAHAVPLGMNWLQDRSTVAQTRLEADQRTSIVGAMQVIKTAERSQELTRQYLQQHNVPDVQLAADAVAENREAFAYVPDLDKQLEVAQQTGSDITIPAADYFTKTDPKLQGKLNEKIRGPSGLTPEEADYLEKNPPDYATVFHGSPHSFESFDINKIGTGEGAQAYGHGLYFAERRGIAEDYRDTLSSYQNYTINGEKLDLTNPQHFAVRLLEKHGDIDEAINEASRLVAETKVEVAEGREDATDIDKREKTLQYLLDDRDGKTELPQMETGGHLYQAKIMRPKEHFLDWDAPLEEQSPYVQEALKKAGYEGPPKEGVPLNADNPFAPALDALPPLTGEDILRHMGGKGPETTKKLSEAGIAGIKYLDAASREDDAERLQSWKDTLADSEKNLADLKAEADPPQHLINMLEGDIEHAKVEIERLGQPQTRNFVVFNDKDVLVTHVNDVARQIEVALTRTAEQIEASMGLRKPTETPEGKPLWLDPMIEAKGAGVPKTTFAQLSRHIQEIQRNITQAAFDHAEREIKRRETPRWKADLADETEAARTEMEQRPDFKAWHGLVEVPKGDPFSVKLDRNETDALFNRESPSDYAAFQKDGTRASESLPKKMFADGGEHPDAAAELFGFNSGKDMLAMLRQHEANIRESGLSSRQYFDGLYAAEGRRRMEQKYGNLQENIMREALAMALDVKQIDVLNDEIALMGGEKITKQRVLDWARDTFAEMKAGNVSSKKFMTDAGRHGNEAFKAATAEKWPEAIQSKTAQMRSFVMAKEARAFEAEKAKLDATLKRYSQNVAVKGTDQRFTDRIHEVMALVREDVPRSEENLTEALVDEKGKSLTFEDFVDRLNDRFGMIVPVGELLQRTKVPAYGDMTVGEVRQLANTINSLNEHGRNVDSIIVNGKKQALEVFKNDVLLPSLDSLAKDINTDTRTAIGQLKTGGRWIDSTFLRAEQLFQWLDKNNPLGPLTATVYRPLKQAEFNFLDGYAKVAEDWNKNVGIDKEWRKTLNQKTKNTILMDNDGKAMTLYRDQMIAMAANVGNEWNFRVLTKGRNWHPDDVMQYLNENMTKKDWEVVQSIWDRFKKLWPEVREASRARTGVAVERIPAREVVTQHGTFEGGYYPLIEEPRSAATRREKAFGIDQSQPFRTLSSISNATNARTGAVYPIDLSLDRLPYTIRETLHEIHFGQALTEAAKVIFDPFVTEGIDKAMGPEYSEALKPWFSYIATDGGTPDPAALGWLTKGSRYLRQNMVTQLVGFRASTGFIHGLSAAANSWAEIAKSNIGDQRYLREALSLLSTDPVTGDRYARKFADESGELRNRFHNMDRDMGAVLMRDLRQPSGLGKVFGDQYDRAAYQALATKHIAYLDYMSALVVYAAKRAESLAKGMPLEDAIFTAEQTVRNAHGSAGLMDLPAVARGSEGWKWFTTFYGYFNHNYNRLRDTGRFVKGMDPTSLADWWQVVSRSMGYLLAPALVHETFRAPPPKPDESKAWWMAKGVGVQIASGVPFVRDAAHAVFQGKLPDQATPMSEIAKGLVTSGVDLHKFATKGTVPKDWVAHVLATPGWLTGHLPGVSSTTVGRLATAATTKTGAGQAQYLWDRAFDVPSSWDVDYWRLLMDGNYHPRKGH